MEGVGDIIQSNNGRTKLIEKIKESRKLGGTISFSLDNICRHTFVAKGLSQICLQDTTKMLGSTDSNS